VPWTKSLLQIRLIYVHHPQAGLKLRVAPRPFHQLLRLKCVTVKWAVAYARRILSISDRNTKHSHLNVMFVLNNSDWWSLGHQLGLQPTHENRHLWFGRISATMFSQLLE
jgi:hypothetical protein